MQRKRRESRYSDERQFQPSQSRPGRLTCRAWNDFEWDLHGGETHPNSHSSKEHVALMHLQPGINGFAIQQLKIRCAFEMEPRQLIQDEVKKQSADLAR